MKKLFAFQVLKKHGDGEVNKTAEKINELLTQTAETLIEWESVQGLSGVEGVLTQIHSITRLDDWGPAFYNFLILGEFQEESR